MVLLSTRAAALVGAVAVMAALASAAPPTPAAAAEALSCAELAARLATAGKSADSKTSAGEALAIVGDVRQVDSDGATHQIVLCGSPHVLCLTTAAEERQVGERLVVTGQPSEAGADYLRLEACTHSQP